MNLFESQMKTFIEDLKVGQRVDTYYRVVAVDKRTKKDGNAFLTLELMDKTGKIAAKVWNGADAFFKMLKPGSIFRFNGLVNEYMNKKELKVDGIKPLSAGDADFNEADYTEQAAFDADAMYGELMALIKSHLSSPQLLKLTDLFDARFGDKFKTHYGAQKIHHAYLGGLLDHTYSMAKLAVPITEHYGLDKELVLMGVLFHDVGKIFEFNITPAPEATMEGGLIGHIVMGNSIFLELTKEIPGFPEALSCKIQHLIISHHGEKEFGSPEVPRIAEAYILHILDLLDSRIKIVEEAIDKSEPKGLFTDFVHALGRRLYVEPETPKKK